MRHDIAEGLLTAAGYLDEELFGPDLCVEIVEDIDEAIARTNALPYELSNAIFTGDPAKFERFYERTRSGFGAEANEKAFDLCCLHGPGGRRVIAFEGSFHGRTLAALHATHNPEKRRPFELRGYEDTFVPFPKWNDPREEPPVDDPWIAAWATGQTPGDEGDPLVQIEFASLVAVRNEIKRGDVCCVIVEPMQGEGGDNYATARFFHGLRALTRGFGVPLVFDKIQINFGLGGPFW